MSKQPRGSHAKRHLPRRGMRRGSVLVASYFALSILILLSIPQTIRSLSSVQLEQRFVDVRQSWQLADGAIDDVARGMLGGSIPIPTCTPTGSPPSVTSVSPTTIGAMSYSGTIEAPSCSALDPASRTYKVTVTSTGPRGSQKTLEAMVELTGAPMRRAIFSNNGPIQMGIDSEFTDSYNSGTGVVCDHSTQSPPCHGDVETRSTDPTNSIQIGSNTIFGVAYTGGGVNGAVSCSTPGQCIKPQPDPTFRYLSKAPPARPNCLNDGIHTYPASGGTVIYPVSKTFSGTNNPSTDNYCFDGGLTITGTNGLEFDNVPQLYVGGTGLEASNNARINWYNTSPTIVQTGNLTVSGTGGIHITGKTDWYVLGTVSVSGGVEVNADLGGQIPNNFRLYVRPDPLHASDSVTYSGSGKFYGILYAPDLPVTMPSAKGLVGAVVANSFSMSGHAMNVHFDEALLNVTDLLLPAINGSGTIKVRAMRSPR